MDGVLLTSRRRDDVASTSMRRQLGTMYPLDNDIYTIQQIDKAENPLPKKPFDEMDRFLLIIFNILMILNPNINIVFYELLRLHGELLVLINFIFMDAKCYFRNPSASLKLLLALSDNIT